MVHRSADDGGFVCASSTTSQSSQDLFVRHDEEGARLQWLGEQGKFLPSQPSHINIQVVVGIC